MLANYWRLRLLWTDADQSIVFDNGGRVHVDFTVWKLVAGLRVAINDDDDFNFITTETIADDGERETSVRTNDDGASGGDDGYGVEGQFIVTASEASTDGIAFLFLETSTDNTNWPSDADQFVVTDLTQIASVTMIVAGSTDTVIADFSF